MLDCNNNIFAVNEKADHKNYVDDPRQEKVYIDGKYIPDRDQTDNRTLNSISHSKNYHTVHQSEVVGEFVCKSACGSDVKVGARTPDDSVDHVLVDLLIGVDGCDI